MILVVPPHNFTYHRNQRAEISWVSAVTHRFTKRVANLFAALFRKKAKVVNTGRNLYYLKIIQEHIHFTKNNSARHGNV